MRAGAMVSILALVAVSGLQAPAVAQDSINCAYAACALRVSHDLFGRSLVRGLDAEKVAGLGLFVGGLDDAFSGSPIAQEHAARFRARHNTGSVLSLLGATVMVVTLFASDYGDFYDDSWVVGLLAGSAVALSGALVSVSGEDHLHRAIWEYNRETSR